MLPYMFLFCLSSIGALKPSNINISSTFNKTAWIIYLFLLILFIGLRYDTGGDWGIYKNYFDAHADRLDLFKSTSDFGYQALLWYVKYLGLGFDVVTLFCGTIFVIGLGFFCSKQDNKWLAITIAFPFLITVVSMGYFRQGAAVGFFLLALTFFLDKKYFYFILFLIFSVAFHKSAIVFFLLILFDKRVLFFNYFIIFALILLANYYLKGDYVRLWDYYAGHSVHLQSKGVYFRYALNFFPALIFIFFSKKLSNNYLERRVFLSKSIIIILSFFVIEYSSTFVDRVLIFFSTIQLIVLPRLYRLFVNQYFLKFVKYYITLYIILFYFIFYYIWFVYSDYSFVWLPYESYIFNFFK